jgi:PAS domain S-box-containing protein
VFFFRSLRAKTVLTALIPTTVVLVAVAIIALYAYDQASGDAERVVQDRDSELARITAARLSEALSRHSGALQRTATDEAVRSLEPDRLSAALQEALDQLYVFDAGVAVYDSEGVGVWPPLVATETDGPGFPVPSGFETMQRTLRPAFSSVFQDPRFGEDVILVGAPIVGGDNEFRGVLAGLSTLRFSPLGATYAGVLELTAGREGFAYLVDGDGRVIHHRDSSLKGVNLADTEPVMRAIRGETGALFTEDSAGRKVLSGFAPVQGTDWGIITQERWDNVVGPIRDYGTWLLVLLAVGGVATGALIFFALGRILKPVKDLTRGAQRIAGGDFDYAISAKTGDEIQDLAEQFNSMAGALKASYAGLEQEVAARTRELRESEQRLRTVITGAPVVLFATDGEGTFTLSEGRGLEVLGLQPGEVVGQSVFDVYRDVPEILDNIKRALAAEEVTSMVQLGGLTFESRYSSLRDDSGEIVGLIGIAVDVTERRRAEEAVLKQTRELAVLEERNRLAREIHDTLAQGFTGIVLQLEAAEQALEGSPDEVPDHLSRAKSLGRESLQEARRSVWDLLPQALEGRALDDALEEEVRRFGAGGQEKATFTVSGDQRRLAPDIQAALLRVCQESLANIRRHAGATEVGAALSFQAESVSLTVRDNGVGFDVGGAEANGRQGGFGLRGMEQRARLLRGTLAVNSEKGKGTTVELSIPTGEAVPSSKVPGTG